MYGYVFAPVLAIAIIAIVKRQDKLPPFKAWLYCFYAYLLLSLGLLVWVYLLSFTSINTNGSLYHFLGLFPFLAYLAMIYVAVKLADSYKASSTRVTVFQKILYYLAGSLVIIIPIGVAIYFYYGLSHLTF